MPEMHFRVQWPDGREEECYSPSWIIEEYLEVGGAYAVPDFLKRVDTALNIASERVRAKYGFACSSALDQLARLQERVSALPLELREREVRVLRFDKHAPRDARRG